MIGKNRKGQGALEYLIIIAGVLAIAAIVVMFLTSGGTSGRAQSLAESCRNMAAKCDQNLQLYGSNYDCSYECAKACSDPQKGNADIMDVDTTYDLTDPGSVSCDKDNPSNACDYCSAGRADQIKYLI